MVGATLFQEVIRVSLGESEFGNGTYVVGRSIWYGEGASNLVSLRFFDDFENINPIFGISFCCIDLH